ncbi:hypothetical protein DEO72_LG8g2236 [Vigna unguiculata]|uniref:Uncharacterized protein n=1 Tax=Vigna unguiculata TaxID=3917 RepID=A0A4D6MS49_VIGUN|nr:hypothetical protein DEO72_LG8g2236 [Vigna unguiculata]
MPTAVVLHRRSPSTCRKAPEQQPRWSSHHLPLTQIHAQPAIVVAANLAVKPPPSRVPTPQQ